MKVDWRIIGIALLVVVTLGAARQYASLADLQALEIRVAALEASIVTGAAKTKDGKAILPSGVTGRAVLDAWDLLQADTDIAKQTGTRLGTMGEVEARLGAPATKEVRRGPDGRQLEVWTYRYGSTGGWYYTGTVAFENGGATFIKPPQGMKISADK